jgi:hypothetical protein
VRVQDTADICVSNNFRQFAALSERNLATTFPYAPPRLWSRAPHSPCLRMEDFFCWRGVLAARFHVGAYLTGVEAADEVIALTPRGI